MVDEETHMLHCILPLSLPQPQLHAKAVSPTHTHTHTHPHLCFARSLVNFALSSTCKTLLISKGGVRHVLRAMEVGVCVCCMLCARVFVSKGVVGRVLCV